ncbi:MAG: IPT/TIG domain-containing protein [Pseudomonadales bacterium]|jgi:sugar lactone lactonase YvrE|nr:IPT/TIG domain-containing protein [Pseudomonadales bacterium]
MKGIGFSHSLRSAALLLCLAASGLLAACGGGGGGSSGSSTPQNNGTDTTAASPVINSFSPVTAKHGAVVTITGTGFRAVPSENSVTLNGVAAQVTAATPEQIRITVPKDLTATGLLRVTVGGKTVVATESFTYEPTYVVSTLAGSATFGTDNGTGTAAQFHLPRGVAVDAAGTVYVADTENHLIRKITAGGAVTTLAGSTQGSGTSQFSSPTGVAVDAAGTVYVADFGNSRISKVTAGGTVSVLAGNGTGDDASDIIGNSDNPVFRNPQDVAVTAAGDFVYVADTYNYRIKSINTSTSFVALLAGDGVSGVEVPDNGLARFNRPFGVAVDTSGTVYVADTFNNLIRKVIPDGSLTASTLAGDGTANFKDDTGTAAKFDKPTGVTVDTAGTVYVADALNHRIRKITAAGVVSTLAGDGTASFKDDTGTAAQFNNPNSVAVDAAGNLYVADTDNHRIRKLTPE